MIYFDNTSEYSQRIHIPKPMGGAVSSPAIIRLQRKDYEITENGLVTIRPDSGYEGISGGSISVYVSNDTATTFERLTAPENGLYVATGNSAYSAVTVNVDVETPYEEGYASGYSSGLTVGYASGKTDGYASGYTEGEADQKAKLTDININVNGVYSRADGYKKVTVNVPTGSTINNQDKSLSITANILTSVTYDQGYTGLGTVTIDVDVPTGGTPTLSALTATTNGDYAPVAGVDGFSAVTVDVPQTGSTINNQSKSVTISQDEGMGTNYISAHTVVNYDQGYTGLESVSVDVAIPCINSMHFGTYTENKTYVIEDGGGRPIRQAIFTVQVPQTAETLVLSALTAENNNGRYFPADYNCDAFSAVTVNVNPTPYYNSGYTDGMAFATSDYGTVVVDNWSDLATAQRVTKSMMVERTFVDGRTTYYNESYIMKDFKGNGYNVDDYPYYGGISSGATLHMPNAVYFIQDLPDVIDLSDFFRNHRHIYKVEILNSPNLCNLNNAFQQSSIDSFSLVNSSDYQNPLTLNYTFQGCTGITSGMTVESGVTVNSIYFTFADCTGLTTLANFQPHLFGLALAVDGCCSDCPNLVEIPKWDWSGVEGIDSYADYYQPFYYCTSLTTVGGFTGFGSSFNNSHPGWHTLDLSYSTGLTYQSLINILVELGTVPAEVTDATLIIGPTNLAKLTEYEKSIAPSKNWTLQ